MNSSKNTFGIFLDNIRLKIFSKHSESYTISSLTCFPAHLHAFLRTNIFEAISNPRLDYYYFSKFFAWILTKLLLSKDLLKNNFVHFLASR